MPRATFLSSSSRVAAATASAVLLKSHSPDQFLLTSAMRDYLSFGDERKALLLFLCLRRNGAYANSFSLSLALQCVARVQLSATGASLHVHVHKSGFAEDIFVQTALVEMYAKNGLLPSSRKVFDEMPVKDVFVHNVLLDAYVRTGNVSEARRVFGSMSERDLVSWNTILHGYVVSGELRLVKEIFDQMVDRDACTWSLMISALVKGKRSAEALQLFREMKALNVSLDVVTMVSLLSACRDTGALGIGIEIHRLAERSCIELDVKLGTALVDMYAKCGDIENSYSVFDAIQKKDEQAWSSMICSLANHGLGKDALDLFSRMISEGVNPSEESFIGVLMACTHSALVNEGRAHFKSMTEVYGIKPRIEHYGCLVDLLGRTGHIEEARQVIKDMPLEPDAIVWRALLGACRLHKNVEIAEEAMANLQELEPHADGHYVLLSNIYAQAKSWDSVAAMRKTIRRGNIERIPGKSSIEVGDVIHEFLSGDTFHPRSSEIFEMLKDMIHRLKAAGYRPLTYVVLQDIDEHSKEQSLAEHSEKMAVAFGLLATPHGTTLRVMKNLRICEDCHSAFKFVSAVYQRKLIVRDRNRFHHFIGGECSCGDFW